jgi:DnaJ family protein C protein 27
MVEIEPRAVQVPRLREPSRVKLLVMGEPGVGKTAIIKRWITGEFSSKYEPTIGIDFYSKLVDSLSVGIWDLSGHPEFFEVRNDFYKETNGLLRVYDVTNKRSFDSMDMWLREANKCGATSAYLAVCGTKADLKTRRGVQKSEAESWCQSRRFEYFEVSASSGQGINDMFMLIGSRLRG